MKLSMLLATSIMFLSAIAAEVVPSSGDVVMIGDAAYVIVDKKDWERMKLSVDDLRVKWECMNSNETGRVALHGKRGHTTISNDTICVEYADGYKHMEAARANAMPRREAVKLTLPKPGRKAKWPNEEIQEARRRALATTNEVSVTVGR